MVSSCQLIFIGMIGFYMHIFLSDVCFMSGCFLLYVGILFLIFTGVLLFQDGLWVTSTDYKMANPDPLRDFAEKLVLEINAHNSEDLYRFCNIYADLDFQVWTECCCCSWFLAFNNVLLSTVPFVKF